MTSPEAIGICLADCSLVGIVTLAAFSRITETGVQKVWGTDLLIDNWSTRGRLYWTGAADLRFRCDALLTGKDRWLQHFGGRKLGECWTGKLFAGGVGPIIGGGGQLVPEQQLVTRRGNQIFFCTLI